MAKPRNMYRQEALSQLSSPEQLDSLMRVINPAGWLALAATGFLLVISVAWGIFGRIPTRVAGEGVLLSAGGISVTTSPAGGRISGLRVALGDRVEAGDLVAEVTQLELAQQLAGAREDRDRIRRQQSQDGSLQERDSELALEALEHDLAAGEAKLGTLRGEVERLRRKLAAQEQLHADGVITDDTLAEARIQLGQAESAVVAAEADLDRLESQRVQARLRRSDQLQQRDQQLDEADRLIAQLQDRLDESSRVVALHSGRVVELMVDEGELVSPGTPVVGIERDDVDADRMQLIAYVSALDSHRIRPGMKVEIVPSVVQEEVYGSLLGTVSSLDEIPSSRQTMMRVLGNEPLATALAQDGLPVEMRVDLLADASTASGYRWTSGAGPPVKLHAGTLCSASVVVREQAPITRVIPKIETVLGD